MIFNLQALRGIAALLVMMHHSLAHFRAMGLSNPVFEFIARNGSVGVDIFFVISGYVMAKTTLDLRPDFQTGIRFILRRFARIFLGYWPIFLLVLGMYYLHQPGYLEGKELFQSFLLTSTNTRELVITPAWSLTYELYFYLIVGLMLCSGWIKPVPAFVLMSVLVILKSVFTTNGDYYLLDFFLSLFLFEFILGYLIFYYWPHISEKKWLFVSLAGVIAGLLVGTQTDAENEYLKFAALGLFSSCLVWLMVLSEKNTVIVFRGLIKKIGDSSYTLYLTHTVLLGLFYSLGIRDFLVEKSIALPGFVAFVILIVYISWIFYQFVEAPLYRGAKRWLMGDLSRK